VALSRYPLRLLFRRPFIGGGRPEELVAEWRQRGKRFVSSVHFSRRRTSAARRLEEGETEQETEDAT
jgi:hypothetical protein